MRVLPFLFTGALLLAGAAAQPQKTGGNMAAAQALVPLAYALGAAPASATVEVYATEIVPRVPSVLQLERELLVGAKWHASTLGDGALYTASRDKQSARISILPIAGGRKFLSCSRDMTVPPAKIAQAVEELWGTPCGADASSVELTATLERHPSTAQIAQALRRVGAQPIGVLSGPRGAYALAELPGAKPQVTVGGRAMNLALKISYDKAQTARVVLGAPTLRPGR